MNNEEIKKAAQEKVKKLNPEDIINMCDEELDKLVEDLTTKNFKDDKDYIKYLKKYAHEMYHDNCELRRYIEKVEFRVQKLKLILMPVHFRCEEYTNYFLKLTSELLRELDSEDPDHHKVYKTGIELSDFVKRMFKIDDLVYYNDLIDGIKFNFKDNK